ncbi:uncharacterized protein LOC111616050 isoform X2 [Centruroides sculpturatus]|uniref:uncharacterized protein LOC111616050 isoform X2 n=1 Tax=Centruroides sculpturatus TaxID=218467 RepID=UPI000C6EE4F8|nr:uncharacterized protein LOC111616050 isoform X2 [Centruroides sculpturatus]
MLPNCILMSQPIFPYMEKAWKYSLRSSSADLALSVLPVAWSKVNNLFDENDLECYTKAKGRFRSSLYKSKEKILPMKTSKKSKYKLYQLQKLNKSKQRKQLSIQDSSYFSNDDEDEGCVLKTEEDNLNVLVNNTAPAYSQTDILNKNNGQEIKNQLSPLSNYCSGNEDISDVESLLEYHKSGNSNLQDQSSPIIQIIGDTICINQLLHENGEMQIIDSPLLVNNKLISNTENFNQNIENVSNTDLLVDQVKSDPIQLLNSSSGFDSMDDMNLDDFSPLWSVEKMIFPELESKFYLMYCCRLYNNIFQKIVTNNQRCINKILLWG